MGFYYSIELYNKNCEFYFYIFFIKFKRKIIDFGNIKEIGLITNERNRTFYASSISKGSFLNTKKIIYELYIINDENEHITIEISNNYNKVLKVGTHFSTFFSLPINETTKITSYTDIENY